ncbi:Aspartic-type endopeptidase ctsD [Penicillium digitatum]|uniref:penicillopepsin n=3 Tax=Penicillium digitatum TaxID=36651 RepID=K9GFA6_PEND2|nr:Aspartic-type endopeptidase ctsD [Penicillium digitatum Pd1]EKV19729.1 Aspartic-type endopeptidase ctsD [Penicillium digitatum PHI26]EKV20786.1 Aspartic-type endopeptidase ctsD [Penicillium digitatum Pd1]QQK44817.1 Aspartic-type endopeptidase ctsD [Penicillium digitatum]
MHLSSFLVVIAGISGVHAFYPWELRILSTETTVERRFVPWTLNEPTLEESTDTKPWTLDLKKMPVRRDDGYKIVESHKPTLANSAPLNQDGTDYSYFSPVLVGSQKQEMWMAIDTGAPNTWVFDSKCTEPVCTRHHKFDQSASTSCTTDGSTFSLFYGSGKVSGNMGKDIFSIAGLEVSQTFGLANNASEAFQSYPFDGILGLGRSRTEGWDLPSFMDLVAEKKLIKSNLVGFSLSRSADHAKDGEINFGDVDTTKFDGTISYTATNDKIWSIPLDDAHVNGQRCKFSGKSATIDTGTTYILIPPADAKVLFSLVPHSSQQPSNPNNYLIPCNSTATIEFEFSGVKYSVSPKDYVGNTESEGSDFCISTIVGYASNGANWLVGDVFLKNVYTVFDFDNGQIGFGALASASSSSSSQGNGTFTAPPVTGTAASTADITSSSTSAKTTVSDSSASHLIRGISWSMLTVMIGAFAI